MTAKGSLWVDSEVAPLERALLKSPRDAFLDEAAIDDQWRTLGYVSRPDLGRAVDEHDALVEILESRGVEVELLPAHPQTGLDSLYPRDALVVSPGGALLAAMGKPQRAGETTAIESWLGEHTDDPVTPLRGPARLEGGDVVWLDPRTVIVGRGYRTDDSGIRQLADHLAPRIDELIVVPLPHWRGPGDVFHLMSILSPVDRDLAVVYSPLMPVPLRERLLEDGYRLIEVPDGEFDSLGSNVLAVAPRQVVVVSGNPQTKAMLEAENVEVFEIEAQEICLTGCGGPTCLVRPLARRPLRDASGPADLPPG